MPWKPFLGVHSPDVSSTSPNTSTAYTTTVSETLLVTYSRAPTTQNARSLSDGRDSGII